MQVFNPLRFAMVGARYGIAGVVEVLGGLLIPLVLVGGAIAVLVAKWNGIKAFFKGFGEGFQKALSPETKAAMAQFGSSVSNLFSTIGKAIQPVTEFFTKVWSALFGKADEKKWAGWGQAVGGAIGKIADGALGLIKLLTQAVQLLDRLFQRNGQSAPGVFMTEGGPVSVPGSKAVHRSLGGSVHAGGLYEVNERGQEFFMPGRSGTIIPAHVAAQLRAGGGSAGSTVNISATINVDGAQDPQATARAVRSELKKIASEARAALHD
jgi:phage-related minor tail protein